MMYKCPKGHESSDSDYCSECGALIGESKVMKIDILTDSNSNNAIIGSTASQEVCPDCGTLRSQDARFCEVCRHDFHENKTGVAEVIVASKPVITETSKPQEVVVPPTSVSEKLNIVISVDRAKAANCGIDTAIKPDNVDRVFPLDLDENLVGRRSAGKGIYPEIEINDPGVSHRHLKFIKQSNGCFTVLELGSANGTELNGVQLEPGIDTAVKAGDELTIGIWTQLKLISR
jgi:RNA polymerase subunit RPABC4/transcription elongation factor Spt4